MKVPGIPIPIVIPSSELVEKPIIKADDFSISIPSYELGNKPIPSQLLEAWNDVEEEVRNEMQLSAYKDDNLNIIWYTPPNFIACPNSNEGLDKFLSDVVKARKELFEKLGITNNKHLQITFICYHEYAHYIQDKNGKLKPFQPYEEVEMLEKEADEYAYQRIVERLQR
jgi:hypothetical protein